MNSATYAAQNDSTWNLMFQLFGHELQGISRSEPITFEFDVTWAVVCQSGYNWAASMTTDRGKFPLTDDRNSKSRKVPIGELSEWLPLAIVRMACP